MNNVAIIGLGSIGKRHLDLILKNREKYSVDKINVFDLNPKRLSAIQTNDFIKHSSLNTINNESDVVFICTPTANHYETFNSLYKGNAKKIYLEKPLSSDLKGFRKFYELENKKKMDKKVVLGYIMRFDPVIQKVKSIIDSNSLGKVLYARAASGFYLPYWHPKEDYRDFYMSSRAQGGGVLLDTSHEIDYLTWLFGDVESVYGTIKHVSDLEIYADDLTRITGRTKKGIEFDIHLDLLQFEEERSLKVITSKAVINASIINGTINIDSPEKELVQKIKFNDIGNKVYENAHDHFFEIQKYPPSEIATLSDGFKVLEVIEAVRMSSAVRSQVNLPLWHIN